MHVDPGGGWDWRGDTRPLGTYSLVKSLGYDTLRRCGHRSPEARAILVAKSMSNLKSETLLHY